MVKMLTAVGLLFFSAVANAGLDVCNYGVEPMNVAIGFNYFVDTAYYCGRETFASKAWYPLKPGECKQLTDNANRRVWLYAEGTNGSRWEGREFQGRRTFCLRARGVTETRDLDDSYVDGRVHSSDSVCRAYGGRLVTMFPVWSECIDHRFEFTGGVSRPTPRPAPIRPVTPLNPINPLPKPAPIRPLIDDSSDPKPAPRLPPPQPEPKRPQRALPSPQPEPDYMYLLDEPLEPLPQAEAPLTPIQDPGPARAEPDLAPIYPRPVND